MVNLFIYHQLGLASNDGIILVVKEHISILAEFKIPERPVATEWILLGANLNFQIPPHLLIGLQN